MEAGHACSEDQEMIDEVESEDQMTYQMAEDNPPDSGAAEVDAEDASVSAANAAAAASTPIFSALSLSFFGRSTITIACRADPALARAAPQVCADIGQEVSVM